MIENYLPLKEDINFKFKPSALNLFLALVSTTLFVAYIYGVAGFLEHGHHAFGTTRHHPWGFLVAAYEFFVAISMGTIAIASAAIFFDIKALNPLVKRMLIFGLLSLISGFSVFLLEIGHPITMVIYTALSGHPTSALFWLGVFYPLTMLFTFLTFLVYAKGKNSKIFAMFALIFANSSILTAGSIFGNINNSPFVSGVFYQIEFLASGMLGGIFLFTIIAKFFEQGHDFDKGVVLLKKVSISLLSLLLIMYLVKYITAVYGDMPGKIEIVKHILNQPRFYLYEVGFGIVIPLLIAVFGSREKIGAFCMASLFGLVGLMVARINVVDAAELVPKQLMQTHMYQLQPTIIIYTPTFVELSIGLGAIGIFMFLMFVSEKILELDD
jgi:molybdopterin-containing oxidoreductase family membrane subunit